MRSSTLSAQGRLVYDDVASELVTQNAGTVNRWTAAGAFVGTVTLLGFGTQFNEAGSDQSRCIATANGPYFTSSEGNLSA